MVDMSAPLDPDLRAITSVPETDRLFRPSRR
jgi:hypothetical protein